MEKHTLYKVAFLVLFLIFSTTARSFSAPIIGAEKLPPEEGKTEVINGYTIHTNKTIELRLGRKLTLKEKIKRWRFKRKLKKAQRIKDKIKSQPTNKQKHQTIPKRQKAKKDDLDRRLSVQSFSTGILSLLMFLLTTALSSLELAWFNVSASFAILPALVAFIIAMIALTSGIQAMKRIRKYPDKYGGKSFAVMGIVFGSIGAGGVIVFGLALLLGEVLGSLFFLDF